MFSLDYFAAGLEAFAGKFSSLSQGILSQELNFKTLTLFALIFFSSFYLFSTVRFCVRLMLMQLCITITAILSIPLCIICAITGYRGKSHHLTGRFYSFLSQLMFNHRYYILDDEVLRDLKNTPVIYIGNHQSSLDISSLGAIFPDNCSVMAKKSLQYVPLVGLYLWLSSTFFIDRNNHAKAIATTSALAKNMQEKKLSVFIYPEGTRSGLEEPTLLPFKKGAFHLALETGFPIVPIVFSNTNNLFCFKHCRFESGGMGIKVLKPICTQGKTKENIQELIDEAQTAMADCLKEISAIDYNKL
ncbi:1-acylglycerol-3-phosphate O-acyltransferase [Entomophthora muscae]|uniref:1-acylglycerol-3-phosphate O-acyltransferase n=3 Tax=Entomophthora muscae TaxID=34485 RepID=A0ACC2TCB9_9FUNG|nr:1-acylglycerol-3-phosphate O-acyltransferase [Entomophthora muscae]KAJ9055658.1 1-acylglycerol-3-phosphate O-acyltransferase [Entomophthora muscae]KAJ9072247.1 1-acylglycerol-3-phosphate O-acyltransferase [Entomophthora muscae]